MKTSSSPLKTSPQINLLTREVQLINQREELENLIATTQDNNEKKQYNAQIDIIGKQILSIKKDLFYPREFDNLSGNTVVTQQTNARRNRAGRQLLQLHREEAMRGLIYSAV